MKKITQDELDDIFLRNVPVSLIDFDSKIDLSQTNLSCLKFRRADLNNSTFLGSDLSSADLSGCSLFLTNFMVANLSYANLSDTVPGEAMFSRETNLYKTILPDNFYPLLYRKNNGHFFKYSFSLMFGNWYIFKPVGNGICNLSEIKDELFLKITLKRLNVIRKSDTGHLYVSSEDFYEEILPYIVENNSLLE